MSNAKHTPGPWKTSRAKRPSDGAYDYAIGADFGDQTLAIAEAFGRVDDDIYPDAEANARLIAAAPDMLEVIKQLLKSSDGWDVRQLEKRYGPSDFVGILKGRAVIAKAEGKS